MQLAGDERRRQAGPAWGVLLAKRMMTGEARPPRQTEAYAVRAALAELPPVLQSVDLKEQRINELKEAELWEVMRKSHSFKTINVSDSGLMLSMLYDNYCVVHSTNCMCILYIALTEYMQTTAVRLEWC
eukprot:13830-Heterococcus_DN1.PRE.3